MGGEQAARHVIVRGRVQGVGYRAWTEDQATLRGLTGFVRNRRDGSVEALLIGTPDAVADMVAACRRGPAAAQVSDVMESEADASVLALLRTTDRFQVLPTA
jgi:acylphosphatase